MKNQQKELEKQQEKKRIETLNKFDKDSIIVLKRLIKSKFDLKKIFSLNSDFGLNDSNTKLLADWKIRNEDILDFFDGSGSLLEECIYTSKSEAFELIESHFDPDCCLSYADSKFGINRNLIFWDGDESGGVKYECANRKVRELVDDFCKYEEQINPGFDKGYVYILTNPSYEGLLKIGKTTLSVEERAKKLSSNTSVPTSFVIAYKKYVSNCSLLEVEVHNSLEKYRVNDSREFFKISIDKAIACIESTLGKLDII